LVRGWANEICRQEPDPLIRVALITILLVEMSARAAPERGLEWVASLVLRFAPCARWRKRGQQLTLGPFQLRSGPWRRADAVAHARSILHGLAATGDDINVVARCWNGPAAATAAVLPYAEALRIAHSEAERLAERVALFEVAT
jgi:hypothetical protein